MMVSSIDVFFKVNCLVAMALLGKNVIRMKSIAWIEIRGVENIFQRYFALLKFG